MIKIWVMKIYIFDVLAFFMAAILKMANLTHFSIEMQPKTCPNWKNRKNAIE